jgi:hypothetical protein
MTNQVSFTTARGALVSLTLGQYGLSASVAFGGKSVQNSAPRLGSHPEHGEYLEVANIKAVIPASALEQVKALFARAAEEKAAFVARAKAEVLADPVNQSYRLTEAMNRARSDC